MPLRQLLEATTLRDVLQAGQKVAKFPHTTSVGTLLEALAQRNILSAPVVVAGGDGRGEGGIKSILGFVAVDDILELYLLSDLPWPKDRVPTSEEVEEAGAKTCARSLMEVFGEDMAANQTAVLMGGERGRDFSLKGHPTASLLSIIDRGFLRPQTSGPTWSQQGPPSPLHRGAAVHRLAVFDCSAEGMPDGDAEILGVCSQTDVVRFLNAHQASLGELQGKTLRELGLARGRVVVAGSNGGGRSSLGNIGRSGSPVSPGLGPSSGAKRLVCVREDMTALEAFRHMFLEHVSGLAVLAAGEEGERLVGNLSATDLRCLAPGLFCALLLPLREFLAKRPLLLQVQQEASTQSLDIPPASPSHSAVSPPLQPRPSPGSLVTCQATSTFGEVLALLVQHKVHRAYVVDPDQRPVGVVTLTDVLATVRDASML